ncbi:hypothetical protein WG901_22810 [Novosphingobium sp. PS1R-30]|uniref:DUF4760 domain-containing protein n=1 Tax=Novosphingobium anseongense TaxID=3133436 RepID=A0ABU8S2R4_9SPHN
MWNWLSNPQAAIIIAMVAVLFAISAILFSFAGATYSVRLSKRSAMISARTAKQIKHAEFRQAWIHILREQMAIFQAKAFLHPNETSKKDSVAEAMLMIMMLVDRRDVHYAELKSLLHQVMTVISQPADPLNPFSDGLNAAYLPDRPLFEAQARFVEICQDILKTEWEITKRDLYALRPQSEGGRGVKTLWSIGPIRLGHVRNQSPGG